MSHDDVVRRFAEACLRRDIAAVEAVLDAEVVAVCDGGGQVPAAVHPIRGAVEVALLVLGLLSGRPDTEVAVEAVNGSAGLALRRDGRATAVISVGGTGSKITALWVVLNPAKLRGWHRR